MPHNPMRIMQNVFCARLTFCWPPQHVQQPCAASQIDNSLDQYEPRQHPTKTQLY